MKLNDFSFMLKGKSSIQNDLLDCILSVYRDEICSEIKRAKYLAILTDDTSDVSEHVDQVIVFRYELAGVVYERFWGFFNPKVDLSECILEQLKLVLGDDHNKLIAQTYEGAANVIKQMYNNAHFVHCYAYQLNAVVERAASQNTQARIFFASLAAILAFF